MIADELECETTALQTAFEKATGRGTTGAELGLCERIVDGLLSAELSAPQRELLVDGLLSAHSNTADGADARAAVHEHLAAAEVRLRKLSGVHPASTAVPKTPAQSGRGTRAAVPQTPSAVVPHTPRGSAARPAKTPRTVPHTAPRTGKKAYSRKPKDREKDRAAPAGAGSGTAGRVPRHPVCLILDRTLQWLPWESMPVLRHNPVSRMPSLPFVVDRAQASCAGGSSRGAVRQVTVAAESTFYVLNPSKDLSGTQKYFEAEFRAQSGWEGIVGEPPSSTQFKQALIDKDILVYCGHGAGQAFLNENQLKASSCHAAALLMGCSSGRLRDGGEFDASGMALQVWGARGLFPHKCWLWLCLQLAARCSLRLPLSRSLTLSARRQTAVSAGWGAGGGRKSLGCHRQRY